jgi:hypothetical protein
MENAKYTVWLYHMLRGIDDVPFSLNAECMLNSCGKALSHQSAWQGDEADVLVDMMWA